MQANKNVKVGVAERITSHRGKPQIIAIEPSQVVQEKQPMKTCRGHAKRDSTGTDTHAIWTGNAMLLTDSEGEASAMSRSSFEERLMLAMGLTDVRQLDELLAAPISQWAADHSEPPDEEYDLADKMYEEADRQRDARQRFYALSEAKHLN